MRLFLGYWQMIVLLNNLKLNSYEELLNKYQREIEEMNKKRYAEQVRIFYFTSRYSNINFLSRIALAQMNAPASNRQGGYFTTVFFYISSVKWTRYS